jgi:DNA polymerase
MHTNQNAFAKLNSGIKTCTRCPLHLTRTQAICGEGSHQSRILLIAQAPGAVEDRQGLIFVGPSGKILDELLAEAGLTRNDVYMTNLVKCCLPKNRRPRKDEINACSGHLKHEISLLNPRIIVPLGFYAARYSLQLLNPDTPQGREAFIDLYGRLFLRGGYKIFPLPHPSCLLHNPSHKPGVAEKYRRLRHYLD